MSRVINYNIHGILGIQINWDAYPRVSLEDLNLKLNYFRVADLEKPDIQVHIGRFAAGLDGSNVYERKYFVSEDSVYCEDHMLSNKWMIQLSGLESMAQLRLDVYVRSHTLRSLLAPGLFAHILLIPILEIKLLKMNYLLLHSAAVSKDGRAYLLSGRGDSFKTSLVMNLVREGYDYMGDERVVVGQESILSFPTHIKILSFCIAKLQDEHIGLLDRVRLVEFLARSPNANLPVTDRSRLAGLLYLSPSSTAFQANTLDIETAVTKMKYNLRLDHHEMTKILGVDRSPIAGCLTAYIASHPDSELAKVWTESCDRMRGIFSNITIHDLAIPLTYNTETTDFVKQFLI